MKQFLPAALFCHPVLLSVARLDLSGGKQFDHPFIFDDHEIATVGDHRAARGLKVASKQT